MIIVIMIIIMIIIIIIIVIIIIIIVTIIHLYTIYPASQTSIRTCDARGVRIWKLFSRPASESGVGRRLQLCKRCCDREEATADGPCRLCDGKGGAKPTRPYTGGRLRVVAALIFRGAPTAKGGVGHRLSVC